MKILVFQVKIDRGIYGYDKTDLNDVSCKVEELLMPSVQKYCNRYGYDYALFRKVPKELNVEWFKDEKYPERNISSTLIRYFQMFNENYDAVVSLDNDIYITPHAEPLPNISGHMGVHDILFNNSDYLQNFPSYYKKIDTSIGIINGGVQMADCDTGLQIKKYIKSICENKTPPIQKYYSDQNYINYFRYKIPEKSKLLENKWNFLVSRYKYDNLDGLNFVHYSGYYGRRILYRDIQKGLIAL